MHVSPQAVGIVHFVGIGGIGMSGIAEILHSLGYLVQGSDLSESINVKRLMAKGIAVKIGHTAENIDHASVLVVSSAVRQDNPELIAARQRMLPIVHRAEMLAELMRLKPSIAVAGTHGKTTTTSLGATVLEEAGWQPTVVSGGIINSFGTNAKLGAGEWVIVEADESDGSFVKLPATHAIITNIDPEHMEHYGSTEALYEAFVRFIENIPFYGLGIVCADHPGVQKIIPRLTDRRLVTYGFGAAVDVKASNVRLNTDGATFDVVISDRMHEICPRSARYKEFKDVHVRVMGEHNVLNALSILALSLELGLSEMEIRQGFASFAGVGRRFTKTGEVAGVSVIDDYAHHPAEIRAVLKTARAIAPSRVLAVFQPHRYSRLSHLFEEFCEAFEDMDHLLVTPIYSAGEDPIPGLNHETFVEKATQMYDQPVEGVMSEVELFERLAHVAQPGDMIICMGAGNITAWAHAMPDQLQGIWERKMNMKKGAVT
ncbi:MAG: UDP-N-acetylmuramate--L-alanine ligase [Holosporales bacterium]